MAWKFKIRPFRKILGLARKSCEKDNGVSSTRVTSFIITSLIILFVLYFVFIGSWIGITGKGSIPNELVIVFGSLLAHQLTLLGLNKYNETKQKSFIQQIGSPMEIKEEGE